MMTARVVYTTSSFTSAEMPSRCGDDCYSYYFVQRAFLPLLKRWGEVRELAQPAELDEAVAEARLRHPAPVHLSFLPPQYMPLAADAPNIAFPFWEYPDIPDYDVAGHANNNWLRLAERLDSLVTACRFTRDAFVRAGVRVPMSIVPVPIAEPYFSLPSWQPDQKGTLECPCYVLPQPDAPRRTLATVALSAARKARQRLVVGYRQRIRPHLPVAVHRRLASAGRGLAPANEPRAEVRFPIVFAPSERLDLSGVVYTSIFNPFDIRKDWRTLVERFLRALSDRDDALLVLKLAVSRTMRQEGLHNLFSFYQRLRVRHRCRVAVVAEYLSDEEMLKLAGASTYYLNTSKAEGLCMPLQDALAAGRPGIAPAHTAMAEYVDERLAFVVPSRDEPTYWPWDPEQRLTTSWRRLDARRLTAQIRESYRVARHDLPRYREMSACGRERMRELASAEKVWPKLNDALTRAVQRNGWELQAA
ncbi:MAG TPA: glycosyltransferase [Pirellulales bacterium]|nr:glycosyltransferase [Pirellulales bacterium]